MDDRAAGIPFLNEMIFVVGEMFDLVGVAFMVVGFLVAIWIFLNAQLKRQNTEQAVDQFKVRVGRSMLLSLEILIAADIVKSVAIRLTSSDMLALGLLVLIRTFLSWTLGLEIEGRWPWQDKRAAGESSGRA